MFISHGPTGAREIRIERRRVLIDPVSVSAGGVCLPQLDKRVRHGPAVVIEHTAFHDDSLAKRLT